MTGRAACGILCVATSALFDEKGEVMSEKRKDNKGRLLRTGESQRKDLSYMYRYKDNDGTRKSVYAPTLAELREKEEDVSQKLRAGVMTGKKMTVLELVDQYLATKQTLKDTTLAGYQSARNHVADSWIANVNISDLTRSAARRYYLDLHEKGLRYSSLHAMSNLLKPAFRQAMEDDLLLKNVFDFPLVSLVKNDIGKRSALSEEDIKNLLDYVRTTPKNSKLYPLFMVLIYTGLRSSEACALTIKDVDFENNRISVNKQTVGVGSKGKRLQTPKTKTSERFVPITPELRPVLSQAVKDAMLRKTQTIVNGCSGFLFTTKTGTVCTSSDICRYFNRIEAEYNKTHKKPLPKLTPHVLRHTFCTRCIERGMDVKSTQYFMGHASATITLNVYAHSSYDSAERAFQKAFGA